MLVLMNDVLILLRSVLASLFKSRAQDDWHRRPVCRSTGTCRGALDRREEPNPGARSHAAGTAAEARPPLWHHGAQLRAPRHHHVVRGAHSTVTKNRLRIACIVWFLCAPEYQPAKVLRQHEPLRQSSLTIGHTIRTSYAPRRSECSSRQACRG